jgi:hypothetical protein
MKLGVAISLVIFVTLITGRAIAAESVPILVSASVSTAGPYGELWEVSITPEGSASLRVHYMGNPFGTLLAQFTLPPDAMDRIRTAIEADRFFDLPAEIAPKASPLHMPNLHLGLSVGAKHHKVRLYDPASIEKDPSAQRFLKVWKTVFAGLPLKPAW